MKGSPGASMRSGAAAQLLPMNLTAMKPDEKNSTPADMKLKARANSIHFIMHFVEPRPSDVRRVTAKPMPDVHAVMPSVNTEKISW